MINIQNLTFGYQKNKLVLNNLNLKLEQGKIYGLLGANGTGKSSLLHQICGIIFPQSGKIQVDNFEPSQRKLDFLKSIYILPEEVDTPNISITTYAEIYSPFYEKFDFSLFDHLLTDFEIPKKSNLHEISYGQKKKVMIAFGIATQTKYLFLDEPTNGLDIQSKKQLRKIIARAFQDDKIIIISTHQVKDLDQLIDCVLILDNKKIILQEAVDKITEKLVFKQVLDLSQTANVIYSEGGLKGHVVVAENINQENSKLDMELFFNAINVQKNLILSIFNKP
ncbi:MAG: ABC transporter ATP-binding protein [Pedobacter sp.]|nr:MAG: ABC transporter ATP-binding protein [Pedobacter sp.]